MRRPVHGGDGHQGQHHQHQGGEAGTETEQQENGRDQLGPHRHLPAQVGREQVEREGEGGLDISEPVLAVPFLQAGFEEFPGEEQAQRQVGAPGAQAVELVVGVLERGEGERGHGRAPSA
ncbi:hypothetical protein D9M68_805980 [compost metagenome]